MTMKQTTKVLGEIHEDSQRMVNLAADLQTRGFNELSKKLDEEARILIRMHTQIVLALKADGVTLDD